MKKIAEISSDSHQRTPRRRSNTAIAAAVVLLRTICKIKAEIAML